MSVQFARPTLTARQMQELAADLGSSLLMKAADEEYRKEQQMLQHRIGSVTMKVIDGEYYQLRPQGWVKVKSLTDIIFQDVRELPVNHRVRSIYPCRIEVGGESHRVNVSFPGRGDLSRAIIDERVALGLARMFGGDDVNVYIGHRTEIKHYRVTDRENVESVGITVAEVGGATTIELEV